MLGNSVALPQCKIVEPVYSISTVADQQLSKMFHKLFQIRGRQGGPGMTELFVQRLAH